MSNQRIIITVGLPGSGKSTWAKNWINNNENWVRVNRDDFRQMLKGTPVCENKIEQLITLTQKDLIKKCLGKRLNVVLDNTHLKKEYINDIIETFKYHADIEFRVFDTPVETCIQRDALRSVPVGDTIIRKMNKDWLRLIDSFPFQKVYKEIWNPDDHLIEYTLKQEQTLSKAIIVDFDNTLSFLYNRTPFQWDRVFFDKPNQAVIEAVQLYKESGYQIIIVSGRDASCRKQSEDWLEFFNVPWDQFFMRPEGDFRKDTIVKKEIYENHIKDKYCIKTVFDDRQSVVDMWRELGLSVFQVNPSFD
jgi:predicted kinase